MLKADLHQVRVTKWKFRDNQQSTWHPPEKQRSCQLQWEAVTGSRIIRSTHSLASWITAALSVPQIYKTWQPERRWPLEGWRLISQRWTSYPTGKLMTSERTVASRQRQCSQRTCESSHFGSLLWCMRPNGMSHNLACVYFSGKKKSLSCCMQRLVCRAKRLTLSILLMNGKTEM